MAKTTNKRCAPKPKKGEPKLKKARMEEPLTASSVMDPNAISLMDPIDAGFGADDVEIAISSPPNTIETGHVEKQKNLADEQENDEHDSIGFESDGEGHEKGQRGSAVRNDDSDEAYESTDYEDIDRATVGKGGKKKSKKQEGGANVFESDDFDSDDEGAGVTKTMLKNAVNAVTEPPPFDAQQEDLVRQMSDQMNYCVNVDVFLDIDVRGKLIRDVSAVTVGDLADDIERFGVVNVFSRPITLLARKAEQSVEDVPDQAVMTEGERRYAWARMNRASPLLRQLHGVNIVVIYVSDDIFDTLWRESLPISVHGPPSASISSARSADVLAYLNTRAEHLQNCSHMSRKESVRFIHRCMQQWVKEETIPSDLRVFHMTQVVIKLLHEGKVAPPLQMLAYAYFAGRKTRLAISELFCAQKHSIPTSHKVLYKLVIMSRKLDTHISEMVMELLHSQDQWKADDFMRKMNNLPDLDDGEAGKKPSRQALYAQKKRANAPEKVANLLNHKDFIGTSCEYETHSISKIDLEQALSENTVVLCNQTLASDETFMKSVKKIQTTARVFFWQKGPSGSSTRMSKTHPDECGFYHYVGHRVLEKQILGSQHFPLASEDTKPEKSFKDLLLSKVKKGDVKAVYEIHL